MDFKPCDPKDFANHVRNDCTGKILYCDKLNCKVNLFSAYDDSNGRNPLHPSKKHDCLRDNMLLKVRAENKVKELEQKLAAKEKETTAKKRQRPAETSADPSVKKVPEKRARKK